MDKTTANNVNTFLGVDPSKAPAELKEAMARTRVCFQRVTRATKQHALWAAERDAAERLFRAAENDLGLLMQRWDPETNTMTETLDEAPPKVAS